MTAIKSILDRTYPASKDYAKFLTGYKVSNSIKGTYENDLLKFVEKKLKSIFSQANEQTKPNVRIHSCWDHQRKLLIPIIIVSWSSRIGEIEFKCYVCTEGQLEELFLSIEAVVNVSKKGKELK